MNTKNSESMYSEICEYTPRGVSSPVRAFDPYPIFAESGKGCMITDVDGNEYVDLCMAYGPLVLGHSNIKVQTAVRKQILKGSVFGMPSEPEMNLLKRICTDVPCAEMARLTNSGTEATMHAIRLARGYTGKNGIVKIDGGFHGSHNDVLVNGTGGTARSWSAGVPEGAIQNTKCISYNDAEALSSLLEKDNDIAAIIMEPIPGNMGVVLPGKNYLRDVRQITKEHDVLLIFDEVITGYRVAKGGAQELTGITPDLCTMGKIIGGGYPAGALAGKKNIMMHLAPSGDVYEAGTFSGNPVTAAAGLATIDEMLPCRYKKLAKRSKKIQKSLKDSLEDHKIAGCVNQAPSMFQVFFGKRFVSDAMDARSTDGKRYDDLFRFMLKEGYYLPPSKMEVNFLSVAHNNEVVDRFCELFDTFLGGVQ